MFPPKTVTASEPGGVWLGWFQKVVIDFHAGALLQHCNADVQHGLASSFFDDAFESFHGAGFDSYFLTNDEAAFHREWRVRLDELHDIAQIFDQSWLVFDFQHGGCAVGGECSNAFFFGNEEEDVAAEDGDMRGDFATTNEILLGDQRQKERHVHTDQLAGKSFFLPCFCVKNDPSAFFRCILQLVKQGGRMEGCFGVKNGHVWSSIHLQRWEKASFRNPEFRVPFHIWL